MSELLDAPRNMAETMLRGAGNLAVAALEHTPLMSPQPLERLPDIPLIWSAQPPAEGMHSLSMMPIVGNSEAGRTVASRDAVASVAISETDAQMIEHDKDAYLALGCVSTDNDVAFSVIPKGVVFGELGGGQRVAAVRAIKETVRLKVYKLKDGQATPLQAREAHGIGYGMAKSLSDYPPNTPVFNLPQAWR